MLALERMHRVLRQGKLTFQPKRVPPIDTIPSVNSYLLAVHGLSLGSQISSKMISALLLAFQTYQDFLDHQPPVLHDLQPVAVAWHQG